MNAFDVLREKLNEYKRKHRGADGHYTSVTNAIISIVNEVEQEYNNGWIPCSERLPEYTDEYNVTVGVASEFGYYEKVTTLRFQRVAGELTKWIVPNDTVYVVIAWKPLPEQYKGV